MSAFAHDSDVVVSSRVRLARNFEDLPFSTEKSNAIANLCVDRTVTAMDAANELDRYSLVKMGDLPLWDRLSLVESHLISKDLTSRHAIGAALLRDDNAISLMINEEDHLRLQSLMNGQQLTKAAEEALRLESLLQSRIRFAYDSLLGYLTACPTNAGTGLRASLMLHLPMLTLFKQMGNVTQSVSKLGLTIRGIYGEGSDALGDLYQVSNQVTLGRNEKDIVEAVVAVGKQLIDMEHALRTRVANEANITLQDRIFRSYGLLRFARQMDANEFMEHWSKLRLGAALSMLPVALSTVDELLATAQDAHAKLYRSAHTDSGLSTDQARCEIIRTKLNPTPQEV